MGSKYLEYNPGLELNIFLMNNEQWTKEPNETEVEQKKNESRTTKIMHDITGIRAQYTT